MVRWLSILTFIAGVGLTAYFSGRGEPGRLRPVTSEAGGVHSMEDGTGLPTPRPR